MKGTVYIVRAFGKDNSSAIKLGFASIVEKRLSTYYCCNMFTELLHTYDMDDARIFESSFHSRHKAISGREWYSEDLYPIMLQEIETYYKVGLVEHLKFQDVVEECQKGDSDYLLWAFKRYDFLHAAIKYLGYEKMKEYEYSQPRIKRALMAFTDKDQESNIIKMLDTYELNQGTFVSNEKLKSIFTEIYTQLGILKTPKAKDIENYYKTKTHQRLVKKDKVNGVVIL
jgi:hypothetical protein